MDLTFDMKVQQRDSVSENIPFSVGNKTILWNKVMKEVRARRYTGPFKKILFEDYIESLIGFIPKDGGKETRLIPSQ